MVTLRAPPATVGPATPRRGGGRLGAPEPGGGAAGTRVRRLQKWLGRWGPGVVITRWGLEGWMLVGDVGFC